MLTAIVAVTLTVPDLAAIERAYGDHLGYEVIERGSLPAELASLWGTPLLADRDYRVMRPASGAPVYLRVIQQEPVEGYAAMKSWGWNSNEILVQDTHAVRDRLEESPFQVIGEPRGLSMNPEIVAMQALGPAGELIYLTRIPEGKSLFNLGSAKSFVDRTFIVVLGGPDMEAMRDFYSGRLGMPVTPAGPSTISVLANAWGMPPDSARNAPASCRPGSRWSRSRWPTSMRSRPYSSCHRGGSTPFPTPAAGPRCCAAPPAS